MKRTMLILSMFILILLSSESQQLYGQISKIKKESKKNVENKKPKPKLKPISTSTPRQKPIVPRQVPPDYNPWEPINNWDGTIHHPDNEQESMDGNYNFDGCVYALGCLNSLAFFGGDWVKKLETERWDKIDPTFVSWDIRAIFDLGYHYSTKQHYIYVDYLPGLRMNVGFLMLDFRFNILTEYTDDFPDSFKSWELLLLFNLIPRKDLKMFIGTGIHREEFSDQSFSEYYIGVKYNVIENKDFIDADIRTSYDYKTGAFPFFEIGARYNIQVLNVNNTYGYITLGAIYQNYYQTHDIWSLRSGIIVNIH